MKRSENKYPNLIPNSARSQEELREMGRKGGIKSGESRRKTRDLRKFAKMFFAVVDQMDEKDQKILFEKLNMEVYGKRDS